MQVVAFSCPGSGSQGSDFSLASLSKKPSQHPWEPTEMRPPREAKAQPSAPNLVSAEGSEENKRNVGQGRSTGLGVHKAGLEQDPCPVLMEGQNEGRICHRFPRYQSQFHQLGAV